MEKENKKIKDLFKKIVKSKEKWSIVIINGEKTLYDISSHGKIYSRWHQKPKLLKPHKFKKTGYETVCLYHNGKKYWYLIHRLVAIHFIPIPKRFKNEGLSFNDLEVNHKCGSYLGKSINATDNLEWCTSSENKYHAYKNGLKLFGENCQISKYKNQEVEIACELLEKSVPLKEIETRTNIKYGTLIAILNGKQWKEISSKYDFSKRKRTRRLYKIEQVQEAVYLLKNTQYSYTDIAEKTGLTRNSVWYLQKTVIEKDPKYFNG